MVVRFRTSSVRKYAQCDVLHCDFYTDDVEELHNHMIEVHGVSEDDAMNILDEYIGFLNGFGGDDD